MLLRHLITLIIDAHLFPREAREALPAFGLLEQLFGCAIGLAAYLSTPWELHLQRRAGPAGRAAVSTLGWFAGSWDFR